MSNDLIFDTLKYANKLKAAGVPQKQAEVHAEAIAELVDNRLATKKDIKALEFTTKHDLNELELRINERMKQLELRMMIKLGAIVVSAISLLVILLKLFKL